MLDCVCRGDHLLMMEHHIATLTLLASYAHVICQLIVRAPSHLEGGSYTVLVPSVPTPMAGALYILPRERVHPVDIPFATVLRVFTRPVLASSFRRRR